MISWLFSTATTRLMFLAFGEMSQQLLAWLLVHAFMSPLRLNYNNFGDLVDLWCWEAACAESSQQSHLLWHAGSRAVLLALDYKQLQLWALSTKHVNSIKWACWFPTLIITFHQSWSGYCMYVSSTAGHDLYSSPFSTVIINCQDGCLMSAGVTWQEVVTLNGTSIWPLITVQKGFLKAKRMYELEVHQLITFCHQASSLWCFIFWPFLCFSKFQIKVKKWKPFPT